MEETSEELTIRIQLTDIIGYAAGGSRIIVEGERVYQANHLLLVGVHAAYEDGYDLFASCLKSSSPSSEPHKIYIRTKPSFDAWTFRCSCKAGLGKCKHVMAVLNHLLLLVITLIHGEKTWLISYFIVLKVPFHPAAHSHRYAAKMG